MIVKIRAYQWPNILGVDVVCIAIAWQLVFAGAAGKSVGWPAIIVLGLSVWLTYMADRLFDAAKSPLASLQSFRHRFAKQYRMPIWRFWHLLFITNVCLSTQLSGSQFRRGLLLLGICLLYTFLNQKLSRRFFPKEVCVALIFTGGVVVFIPTPIPLGTCLSFAMICLLNCLIIGAREKEIDAEMDVHSIAPLLSEGFLLTITVVSGVTILFISQQFQFAMAVYAFLLGGMHYLGRLMSIEDFRVLTDAALLIGAVFAHL
jgi:hypothetical protein